MKHCIISLQFVLLPTLLDALLLFPPAGENVQADFSNTLSSLQTNTVNNNIFTVSDLVYDVRNLPLSRMKVRSIIQCAHMFYSDNSNADAFVYYPERQDCWVLDSSTYGLNNGNVDTGEQLKVGKVQTVNIIIKSTSICSFARPAQPCPIR